LPHAFEILVKLFMITNKEKISMYFVDFIVE
jgi:hypothetical protein